MKPGLYRIPDKEGKAWRVKGGDPECLHEVEGGEDD